MLSSEDVPPATGEFFRAEKQRGNWWFFFSSVSLMNEEVRCVLCNRTVAVRLAKKLLGACFVYCVSLPDRLLLENWVFATNRDVFVLLFFWWWNEEVVFWENVSGSWCL